MTAAIVLWRSDCTQYAICACYGSGISGNWYERDDRRLTESKDKNAATAAALPQRYWYDGGETSGGGQVVGNGCVQIHYPLYALRADPLLADRHDAYGHSINYPVTPSPSRFICVIDRYNRFSDKQRLSKCNFENRRHLFYTPKPKCLHTYSKDVHDWTHNKLYYIRTTSYYILFKMRTQIFLTYPTGFILYVIKIRCFLSNIYL